VGAVLLALLAGCDRLGGSPQVINTGSEYQAVFLDNGQAFFGKLQDADKPYPLLTDVFYVQSQVNPETKQTTSVLIRRGKEWHGPSSMYINARHIVAIEPVGADSKVAQLIAEAKKQEAAAAKK